MNIALLYNQYKRKGGMDAYFFDLIRGFLKEGDTVDVYVFKVDKNLPLLPNCIVHKIPVWVPRVFKKPFFNWMLQRALRKKKFDLIISLTRTTGQDIVACGGTHKGYTQVMSHVLNWHDRTEIALEQKSFDSSRWVVAHSKRIRDEIVNLYHIDPNKIKVIYPPVNTEIFSMRERKKKSKKIKLLFPSVGHKVKNLPALLEAFSLLPADQFELIIAGNKLSQTAENIKYVGYIQDMPAMYAEVDFTILPSIYEAFGLVVVESIQCGTPVIVSDRVGASELLTPDEGLVFSDISPQGIADAIQKAAGMSFPIQPNFIERHGLTVDAHIAALKKG